MRTLVGFSPTTQRIEGYPLGECVRASYATLLDLPIRAIPRFDPAALRPGEEQRAREQRWLSMIGLELIEIPAESDGELPLEALDFAQQLEQQDPPVDHLLSGLSPRGLGHRCVGRGGRLIWDPHPSRAGLVRLYSIAFVVPKC